MLALNGKDMLVMLPHESKHADSEAETSAPAAADAAMRATRVRIRMNVIMSMREGNSPLFVSQCSLYYGREKKDHSLFVWHGVIFELQKDLVWLQI